MDRLQGPPVDGRVSEPVRLEEVLDMRERSPVEGLDYIAWADGIADYVFGRVIWAEGTGSELLTQHGELIPDW